MFSGFNLELDANSLAEACGRDFEKYRKIGEEHLSTKINHFNDEMKRLVNHQIINGSHLQEYCFPNVDADIFLSHSHKDMSLANALAGWIYDTFNLKVFIDSNVWEYSRKLLKKLNSRYSNKRPNGQNGVLYDYKSCCKASEHVNTMLSTAFHQMIDKVECVMFLNTDNSVKVISDNQFSSTYSPWIYSEIMCTQIVRKKPLLCYREYNELMHFNESERIANDVTDLVISYNLPLKHLKNISASDLKTWFNEYQITILNSYEEYPLDALYSFTYNNELKISKELFRLMDRKDINTLKKYFAGEENEVKKVIDVIKGHKGGDL